MPAKLIHATRGGRSIHANRRVVRRTGIGRDLRLWGHPVDLPTIGGVDNNNQARPALISTYRSDEAIRAVLQEICARPTAVDGPSRRHARAILDDLAEEMIGRSHPDDPDLKKNIQHQRERWADPVPPITDPSKP